MVTMVTMVINHVMGAYLIPVKGYMATVLINLDVNLDGSVVNLGSGSVASV